MCPMAGDRHDFIRKQCYPDEVEQYIDIIKDTNGRDFPTQADTDRFINVGGWKVRSNGRDIKSLPIKYTETSATDLEIVNPSQDWTKWLQTLGTYFMDGNTCVLNHAGDTYTFDVVDEGKRVIVGWHFRDAQRIVMPSWLKAVSPEACQHCTSLTDVVLPTGAVSIGEKAFEYCKNLRAVTIPEGVTAIGNSAFHNCANLTSVTIPESVTSIGHMAFCGCSSLKDIKIPESATSISGSAFQDCKSLTNVTIPAGVTEIGWGMFSGCDKLINVEIPASVTRIGRMAFLACRSLEKVYVPQSVQRIDGSAFECCEALKRIEVAPDNSCYSKLTLNSRQRTQGQLSCTQGQVLVL